MVKTDMRNFRFFRCFRFFGLQIDGLRDQCESVEISKCILRGGGLLIVQLVIELLMQKVITNATILLIAYIFFIISQFFFARAFGARIMKHLFKF